MLAQYKKVPVMVSELIDKYPYLVDAPLPELQAMIADEYYPLPEQPASTWYEVCSLVNVLPSQNYLSLVRKKVLERLKNE